MHTKKFIECTCVCV